MKYTEAGEYTLKYKAVDKRGTTAIEDRKVVAVGDSTEAYAKYDTETSALTDESSGKGAGTSTLDTAELMAVGERE